MAGSTIARSQGRDPGMPGRIHEPAMRRARTTALRDAGAPHMRPHASRRPDKRTAASPTRPPRPPRSASTEMERHPRARRLYERLGYRAAGRQHASWEYEDDDGLLRLYETTLTILRKRL